MFPSQVEQIPAWEPDVKSHIPPNVTLDSRQAAYSQQSNPPAALRSSVTARQDPSRSRAGMLRRPAVNGIVIVGQAGSSRSTNGRDKGGKGKGKMLDPTTSGGIAGEYVLDPSLPFSLPDLAVNLSRIGGGADGSQGMKRKRGSIDGEPPSAVFKTEQGDVDLRLSVVNEETMRGDDWRVTERGSGLNGSARAKSKRAKVEVSSVRGHVRVDLVSPATSGQNLRSKLIYSGFILTRRQELTRVDQYRWRSRAELGISSSKCQSLRLYRVLRARTDGT